MSTYFGFTPSNQSGSYFISYNSEDAERVAPIAFAMHQSGVPLWYDQGLVAGEQWEKQIAEHIASCKAVIMFVTKKLMQRERLSYVRLEYNLATSSENNKKVYIALLDDIKDRDVNIQHKMWWQQILLWHCIERADADKIMTAIGHGSGRSAAPSESSLSAGELNQLGYEYHCGKNGKPQDYAQAVKYYRLAADQGFAMAQYNLGICYYNGQGVPEDDGMAAKYYRLAADQGYAKAQYNLGACYYWGQGVPQDYAQAVKYYRLAVDQGFANAQYNLGVCYYFGQGVPQDYAQDYAQAVKYYRLAADQGHVKAQFNLALCYEKGQGVAKNLNEAIRLYRHAAEAGNDKAKKALARLGVR